MDLALTLPQAALALALGYLLGSVPYGLVLTRIAGTEDIRGIGSGNIGATNVLRTGRKGLAAATLACDVLKGTAAVLIAGWLIGRDAALVAGFAAFLGHLFPVWLKFKGGKGVATFLGVLIGFAWMAAAGFGAVWLAVAGLARYSSLAALLASAATPAILWFLGEPRASVVFAVMTVLLWIMHRENIRRLATGTEGRIGKKG